MIKITFPVYNSNSYLSIIIPIYIMWGVILKTKQAAYNKVLIKYNHSVSSINFNRSMQISEWVKIRLIFYKILNYRVDYHYIILGFDSETLDNTEDSIA